MSHHAEAEKHAKREEYEFPPAVIIEVQERSGGLCEVCVVKPGTEVHHMVPVAEAIAEKMPPEQIRTAANALNTCDDCHQELDTREPPAVLIIPRG